jgi:hypothetical protein
MNLRNRQLGAAILIAIAAISASGSVRAAMLDSSLFNHRYEGDNIGAQLTGVSGTFDVFAGESPTWNPTSVGGILEHKNTIANANGYFDSVEWNTDVTNASGWTVEFRLKIGTDGDEDPVLGTFQWFGKEANSTSSTRRAGIAVGKSKVVISQLATPLVVDTNDNTDAFHIYRVAQPANSSDITVWRDGVQLYNGVSRATNSTGGPDMWWGDGSGGIGGPTVFTDYFRWDSTGPFEPVPEPGSVFAVVMPVGAWSVLFRRRKRMGHVMLAL